MDIFGSLFPRTGRNFIDAMTQQRMAEERAARQQAAMIANMPQGTGAITNVEPSRAGTIGNYLFGSLSGMGMPTRLANDYAGYGQTAADMTLPGTLDQLDRGDLEGVAMSMVGGVPGSVAKKGIKAFHGSPHSFDKFSMDKIGTGEGAQAYGHGLYFAENEGVAKSYRDALSDTTTLKPKPEFANDPELARIGKQLSGMMLPADDINGAIRELGDRIAVHTAAGRTQDAQRMGEFKALLERNADKYTGGGSMYEVNIAADPEQFLDWDKPLPNDPKDPLRGLLYDQSSELRGSVYGDKRSIGQEAARQVANPNLTGEGFHHQLSRVTGDKAKAAEAIKQAGIPGIKYLDAGSRVSPLDLDGARSDLKHWDKMIADYGYQGSWTPEGHAFARQKVADLEAKAATNSRNYVVFDDNLISIVKKYGIPAALGAGLITEEMARQMQEQGLGGT